MAPKLLVLLGLVVLLATPLLLRPDVPDAPETERKLIIITPHNELIREEYARAFSDWHEREHGEPVDVVYSLPGGTSEIRKMLHAQFAAAIQRGEAPGGSADIVFGGGSYEHERGLKRGVRVTVEGENGDETRDEPISAPVPFDQAWLDEIYGENLVGDASLYDEEGYWYGTALSGFGIVFNRDMIAELGLPEPQSWDDLCRAELIGRVALVNPAQSGSITTAFEAILQRVGWRGGWEILRRAGANARYFSASSLKPPADVSHGDAAMGVCIDFFGRYQAQAITAGGGGDRVAYFDPPGVTMIDPDPVSVLRGAPNAETARRFIEFCLSEEGQALWQFRAADRDIDGLGPRAYELRRLPIRRSMYESYMGRMVDQVNPYEVARPLENPNRSMRAFISIVFASMVMDNHDRLRHAWEAITSHPAYPDGATIVRAEDVDDPGLREMLERFDAMPEVAGPGGTLIPMADDSRLAEVAAGWLKSGWEEEGLWPEEARPGDEMRDRFVRFYREQYERIVELGGG